MPLSLVSGPRALPISLTQAKAHLKVDVTDDDVLISGLIRAVTNDVQNELWRQLVTATFDDKRDQFPACWELPRSPLRKIEHVKYLDDDGDEQTLGSSIYRVDAFSEPGRLVLDYAQTWPNTYPVINAVTARFIGGYATPFTLAGGSPNDTLEAPGHPYSNGDLVRLSTTEGDLPAPLDPNTDYYAVQVSAGASLGLAETLSGAPIPFTDEGTGTHFLGVIPEDIIAFMLVALTHLYENRGRVRIGNIVNELPHIASLISAYSLVRP